MMTDCQLRRDPGAASSVACSRDSTVHNFINYPTPKGEKQDRNKCCQHKPTVTGTNGKPHRYPAPDKRSHNTHAARWPANGARHGHPRDKSALPTHSPQGTRLQIERLRPSLWSVVSCRFLRRLLLCDEPSFIQFGGVILFGSS